MSDIAIKVENVSKNFALPHEKANSVKQTFLGLFRSNNRTIEVQHALKNVSFEVKKGEFLGIVGRNGSGKSTLLKMLAEIYQPNKGKVSVDGRLVPFIELGVGFNPELTGKENVYLNGALLNFSKDEIDTFYNEVVEFAELEKYMDKKLKNYSSGMQVRLAFSMAVRARADILLIDEVLAVGDADFQRKCFEYFKKLKRDKKTVVFVSHDMDSVKEFCDRAILIEENELKLDGKPQDVAREYSKLFLENDKENSTEADTRWGNGYVRATKAKAKVEGEYIIVDVTAKARQDVEKLVYGVHIVAPDGVEITAINNRTIGVPNITDVKAGETITLQWKILNVFNDGRYSVTTTFIDDASTPFDWHLSATHFTVKRIERTIAPVLPPIKVESNIT